MYVSAGVKQGDSAGPVHFRDIFRDVRGRFSAALRRHDIHPVLWEVTTAGFSREAGTRRLVDLQHIAYADDVDCVWELEVGLTAQQWQDQIAAVEASFVEALQSWGMRASTAKTEIVCRPAGRHSVKLMEGIQELGDPRIKNKITSLGMGQTISAGCADEVKSRQGNACE